MLSNYIKMTWAVMKRRKFYTFISLFGISFTLLTLIVLSAFIDNTFHANYPEPFRDRTLYADRIIISSTKEGWINSGPLPFRLIEDKVKKMTSPEKVAMVSYERTTNAFSGNQKFKLNYRYTDANYWEITRFDFLQGRPFRAKDIENNEKGVVINDFVSEKFFGKNGQAVGKNIEIENVSYPVIGVVRGVPTTQLFTSADIYFPYNCGKFDLDDPGLHGPFIPVILARSPSDIPVVQAEYQEIIRRLETERKDEEMDRVRSEARTFSAMVTGGILRKQEGDHTQTMYLLLFGFALLFMSLPALNLVNVNISRIMERASEIGVRRACGGSVRHLLGQFVVENVLISMIGGGLALALSALVLWYLNREVLWRHADLHINWRVGAISIALSIVFGLISGVYPAWRMSKLPIADALRG
jgi:putative ABC transport system permease protein